jgi:hypothetical protein
MRSDVHSAALRAAAKVAFSVAFLGGCGGATSSGLADEDLTANGKGAEPGKAHGDAGQASSPAADAATTNPSGPGHDEDASTTPPLACAQAIDAAFPVEGDYPGTPQAVSVHVQECCADALAASQGVMEHHRWDCCANLPADAGNEVAIACTPWGPPVPPSMKRRSNAPSAWALAVGVA